MFAADPPRPAVDNILIAKMRGGQVRELGTSGLSTLFDGCPAHRKSSPSCTATRASAKTTQNGLQSVSPAAAKLAIIQTDTQSVPAASQRRHHTACCPASKSCRRSRKSCNPSSRLVSPPASSRSRRTRQWSQMRDETPSAGKCSGIRSSRTRSASDASATTLSVRFPRPGFLPSNTRN